MTKTAERTKVVVRRLPPYLREEDFKAELEKVASGSYSWFRFCQGKTSTKRQTYSRVYLNFHESKGVVDFKSKFDGFVFVGARGAQYRCTVEYAPYQRMPKQKSRADHREGTIETDPDFIEFLENLDKAPVMLPSAQRQYEEEQAQRLASGEDGDTIVVTPLMEFIVNKHFKRSTRSGRDRREDRRRESKSKSHSRSRQTRPPPKVLLRTRPASKGSESTEKTEKKPRCVGSSGEKEKKTVKVRAGHQAWVPKVMMTGVSSLDSSNDKNSNTSETTETSRWNKSDKKGSAVEPHSSGRSRGRRHRGGKGHPSKSPNTKVVWVPKTEKQGGE